MRPVGGWLFGRAADKHGAKIDAVIGVNDVSDQLVIACLPGL